MRAQGAESTSSVNVLQSCRWNHQWRLSGNLYERVFPAVKRRSHVFVASTTSFKNGLDIRGRARYRRWPAS